MAKRVRQARSEEDKQSRQAAILSAALEVFVDKGFAAARLEDVAARAGVAKGTVYLYFASKEALLEMLVQRAVSGPIETLEQQFRASDMSAPDGLRMLVGFFAQGILASERRRIVTLILTEAPRFPQIAAFYHREVVSRGMSLFRAIAQRGRERGDFVMPEIEAFPQLVMAPALMALIWKLLFDEHERLDATAMLQAHLDILLRAGKGTIP